MTTMQTQLMDTPQPLACWRCGGTQADVREERQRIETILLPRWHARMLAYYGPAWKDEQP